MPGAAGQRLQQQQDSISAHTSAVTNQLQRQSQYPLRVCWRLPGLRQLPPVSEQQHSGTEGYNLSTHLHLLAPPRLRAARHAARWHAHAHHPPVCAASPV